METLPKVAITMAPTYLFRRLIGVVAHQYHFSFSSGKDIAKKIDRNDFLIGDQITQEKLPTQIWPKKCKAAFHLQLDDFCVKSKQNAEYDYGGDPTAGVSLAFLNLLQKHPFLKTTIFVIPNPIFIENNHFNHKTYPQEKYSIASPQHKKWVQWITSKKFQKQCEIANHGLFHLQLEKKNILPFCEFEFKTKEQCLFTLKKSQQLFEEVGITPRGFKPSAWGIGHNSNFGLLEALTELDFDYVCLSSPVSGLNWGEKRVSNIYPTYYNSLLNIPQNINMNWSLDDILHKVNQIIKRGGIIAPQLHFNAEDAWMSDGIGPRNLKKLDAIINHLNKNHKGKIWYAKAEEIATWWRQKRYLQ